MPGHRAAARGIDGRADEHVGAGRRVRLLVAYGYIVERLGSYDAPFVPMAAALFVGTLLWLKIDASTELSGVHREAA